MLTGLSHTAREAKSWPFEQARGLLARITRLRLSDAERDLAAALFAQGKFTDAVQALPALGKPVVFQCGYGASGLPHMGTFGEAARPTMVRNAFRALTEDAIPTQLIVFSDDMDGLRKIPSNLPNAELLEQDRDKPVSSVRDPYGEYESFAAHNNARMRAFLDGFGFDYTFMSSTETYKSGRFDAVLKLMLERFDAIQAIMLPTLGEERRATYSPFLPISPKTGKVLDDHLRGRGRDPHRSPGHQRPCEASVASRLGGALDGARGRLRSLGQGSRGQRASLQPGGEGARRRAAGGLPLRALHG